MDELNQFKVTVMCGNAQYLKKPSKSVFQMIKAYF